VAGRIRTPVRPPSIGPRGWNTRPSSARHVTKHPRCGTLRYMTDQPTPTDTDAQLIADAVAAAVVEATEAAATINAARAWLESPEGIESEMRHDHRVRNAWVYGGRGADVHRLDLPPAVALAIEKWRAPWRPGGSPWSKPEHARRVATRRRRPRDARRRRPDGGRAPHGARHGGPLHPQAHGRHPTAADVREPGLWSTPAGRRVNRPPAPLLRRRVPRRRAPRPPRRVVSLHAPAAPIRAAPSVGGRPENTFGRVIRSADGWCSMVHEGATRGTAYEHDGN